MIDCCLCGANGSVDGMWRLQVRPTRDSSFEGWVLCKGCLPEGLDRVVYKFSRRAQFLIEPVGAV